MHTSLVAHACPISSRRTPHQQPTHTLQHLTMQQHTHASSAPHALPISTPTHIYTYTLLTLRCDTLIYICILNIKTYRFHGTSLTHLNCRISQCHSQCSVCFTGKPSVKIVFHIFQCLVAHKKLVNGKLSLVNGKS